MDPRAKLLTTLIFIFMVVLTPDGYFVSYGIYACILSVVIIVSRLPVKYILVRSLTIVPFALAVSVFVPFITPGTVIKEFSFGPVDAVITDAGLVKFASLLIRAMISFYATIILVSSTRFGDLMCAAGALGMPAKIVALMSFMYRYLFIIIDEASHMILARDLRSVRRRKISLLAASGGIIGALFLRSFEHAERLYNSMLLRGYSGRLVTLAPMSLSVSDAVYSIVFIDVSFLGLMAGRCVYA